MIDILKQIEDEQGWNSPNEGLDEDITCLDIQTMLQGAADTLLRTELLRDRAGAIAVAQDLIEDIKTDIESSVAVGKSAGSDKDPNFLEEQAKWVAMNAAGKAVAAALVLADIRPDIFFGIISTLYNQTAEAVARNSLPRGTPVQVDVKGTDRGVLIRVQPTTRADGTSV